MDDCKPAISSKDEFSLVDKACRLFELSSGCKLHRDPSSNKCKFLPLGRWKGSLEQEDIPLPNLKITDHLDYLGCKLYANYSAARSENGDILKLKIRDQLNSWKSGKFMSMTLRPWSLNTYCLPKLWYRTACLNLRVGDSTAIASYVKGWLYQDTLIKPQEMVMYRETAAGGLGVHNVKCKAMACSSIPSWPRQSLPDSITTCTTTPCTDGMSWRRETCPTLDALLFTPPPSSPSSEISMRTLHLMLLG